MKSKVFINMMFLLFLWSCETKNMSGSYAYDNVNQHDCIMLYISNISTEITKDSIFVTPNTLLATCNLQPRSIVLGNDPYIIAFEYDPKPPDPRISHVYLNRIAFTNLKSDTLTISIIFNDDSRQLLYRDFMARGEYDISFRNKQRGCKSGCFDVEFETSEDSKTFKIVLLF